MAPHLVYSGPDKDPKLTALGKVLGGAWPVEGIETTFDELLSAIDEADRQLQDRKPSP